ncbi:MFS general substrate transporter [Mytilinidion resinicola]|uniref:MFS general substrate transporter n=1 Tax=Mytilinidion resinicola TaxID=574789 RepID=A0A6A6Z951_9PEZI|nr:MFS general substrate transporter [Mytilinidion resinicola]KAF2816737.1 MFS general substrate transporter [Mytilinidion resinicola]
MDDSEKKHLNMRDGGAPSPPEPLSGDGPRKEMGKEMGMSNDKNEDTDSIAPSAISSTSPPSMHEDSDPERPRPRTQASSIASTAHHVDRRQRRGLFAALALIPEVTNSYHYPRRTKWMITVLVAIAGMAAPLGSAIVMPVLLDIAHSFHASTTIANLNVAIYMLSMSIFPLWWSSFSETLGRRSIYLVSFVLFLLFGVLAAVSTSMAMLIVMRVLSGGAAASVQAVGAGTIADIWEPKERGRAMGLFYLGPLCGPLFAPIIGGAMGQGLGWRSTQWFLVVYGAVMVLGILFLLPETLAKRRDLAKEAEDEVIRRMASRGNKGKDTVEDGEKKGFAQQQPQTLTRMSTRQSVQIKTRKYATLAKRIFIDPLLVLAYLRYPAVALTVYYASICFGSLYCLNISIQQTFSRSPYNFSTLIIGLLYIPNSLGYFLASMFGGRWIDRIMHREATKAGRYDENGKLSFRPEDRMRENAWLAAVMWPGALIWYGWTAEKGVFWFVPMLANFFFGIGSMLIFGLATTMLTEFMPRRASSGIAINNFVRNIFSCAAAVAAGPIIDAIGNGWLFTILGLWSVVSGCAVIWAMKKYGDRWRRTMGEGGI